MVVRFTNTVAAKNTFHMLSQQSLFSKLLQKFILMYYNQVKILRGNIAYKLTVQLKHLGW